jgi:hypothetical protein
MKKLLFNLALVFGIIGAGTVYAAQTTVPVSSLEPAVQLDKPQLYGTGGKLILSDSPETFASPGAFYRDRVEGEFRVFWHHQNAASQPLSVGVAVTNTSADTVKLYIHGKGVGTNIYVDVAGQTALADFMATQNTTSLAATLGPGQSYYVTAPTDPDITDSGIVQFIASSQPGNKPAQVTVTTLGYNAQPEHPDQIAILPGDSLTRGTFPHFDRMGTMKYDTSMGNAYLSVDSDAVGPWSGNAMPGEYEQGWDAVDGANVINNGNYGVMYHLTADITNSYHHPRTVGLYLNPAGGYGHYAIQLDKQIYQSDFLSYEDAWNIIDYKLNPNGGEYLSEISLTGGSSGPQVLYLTNQAK